MYDAYVSWTYEESSGFVSIAPQRFTWSDFGLLATIVIWSANMAIVKSAFESMPPLAFNAVRFMFTPLLMLLIVWFIEKDLRIDRTLWRTVALVGLIGSSGYQLFFVIGLNLTSAANTALLVATTPIWVALIGQLRCTDTLSSIGWTGIVLSFVGVFIILFNGDTMTQASILGDILAILSAMCWAYYTIGARPVLAKYSPLKVTAWTLSIGSIPIMLIGIPETLTVDWGSVTIQGWGGMAYSVLLSIILAYILWYNGVVKVGATRTGIYTSLLPAGGVISAYLILGDPITVREIIGTMAIVLGLYLTRRG
ncbi:MAG: DMT family transporter [Chloroflexi bacterium]|nr:DMT family transporter [Chloroflexota bacterium]